MFLSIAFVSTAVFALALTFALALAFVLAFAFAFFSSLLALFLETVALRVPLLATVITVWLVLAPTLRRLLVGRVVCSLPR